MRIVAIIAAGIMAAALSHGASAAPLVAKPDAGDAPVVRVQTKKDETVGQKVKDAAKTAEKKVEKAATTVKKKAKRAWKRVAGYKFEVGCPALVPVSTKTCRETGKDREAARAKCQSQNPFCSVKDAN